MKITSVETFIAGLDRRNYLFVRVQTDEGIHGIGEAYSCGPDEATAAVIAHTSDDEMQNGTRPLRSAERSDS